MTSYNDARWWNETLGLNHLLGAGLLYEVSIPDFSLAVGLSRSFGGITGDLPVYVPLVRVAIIGSRNIRFENFVGGAISGGATRPQLPRNHFRPVLPTPFVSLEDAITIDVPGTLISVSSFSDANSSGSGVLLINAPNTLYYTTVTNDDNQTADSVEVSSLMARYRELR